MSARRLDGMLWWIDRWRTSSAFTHLTLEEQGAYRNLIEAAWLREGVLPDDDRILANACGDATAWPRLKVRVLAYFERTPEGWRNTTADEIRGKLRALRGHRRAAGLQGAAGRWGR